jgi:hypothetical protein
MKGFFDFIKWCFRDENAGAITVIFGVPCAVWL